MVCGFADGEEEEGRFNINGLEIDLDELEAFERQVADKKKRPEKSEGERTEEDGPDYLDEYLERLQINEEDAKAKEVEEKPPQPPISFVRLLLMFMSLVSMAKLLGYGNHTMGESDHNSGGTIGHPN